MSQALLGPNGQPRVLSAVAVVGTALSALFSSADLLFFYGGRLLPLRAVPSLPSACCRVCPCPHGARCLGRTAPAAPARAARVSALRACRLRLVALRAPLRRPPRLSRASPARPVLAPPDRPGAFVALLQGRQEVACLDEVTPVGRARSLLAFAAGTFVILALFPLPALLDPYPSPFIAALG